MKGIPSDIDNFHNVHFLKSDDANLTPSCVHVFPSLQVKSITGCLCPRSFARSKGMKSRVVMSIPRVMVTRPGTRFPQGRSELSDAYGLGSGVSSDAVLGSSVLFPEPGKVELDFPFCRLLSEGPWVSWPSLLGFSTKMYTAAKTAHTKAKTAHVTVTTTTLFFKNKYCILSI